MSVAYFVILMSWILIFDGIYEAVRLIVSADKTVLSITLRSLQTSSYATLLACLIGLPISVVVASRDYDINQLVNVCDKVLEKGTILPSKRDLDIYKTSRKLKKGEDSTLDIDIVEGESEIPDRNTFLCK